MRINVKWTKRVGSSFLIAMTVIILNSLGFLSDLWAGACISFLSVYLIIKTHKMSVLVSPILSSYIMEFALGLYMMKLVSTKRDLPLEALIVIEICIFLWRVISVNNISFGKKNDYSQFISPHINRHRFTCMMTLLFIVASGAMIFEWYKAGGIPLLRDDLETFRFTVPYSGKTHIFAVLNKVIAALIGIYFVNKGRISITKDMLLLMEMVVSELLMIGTAMRGEMIAAPILVFIFYTIKKKRSKSFYLLGTMVTLLVIGGVPIYRMIHSYGSSYIGDILRISKYKNLFFLTPLYQSFSSNYDTLALDIALFPRQMCFGYGVYSILPQIPFVDWGESLMAVQNRILNNSFYSGLTATYLASWYADFGYLGCIIITVVYSCLTNFSLKKWIADNSLFSLIWYMFTLYNSLWLFYNSTFDMVYVFDTIILWIVLSKKKTKRTTRENGL